MGRKGSQTHGMPTATSLRAQRDSKHTRPQANLRLDQTFLKAHRLDPKLHRVLAEQIPRVGKLEKLETFSRENFSLFRAYLEGARNEIGVDDLELASFVCVTTIEALTHNAVLHHSKVLSDDPMEALIDESARLVTGYLKGWRASTPTR
ncbi:arginyl-tRNA--protein-N-Asp/Glu arginylyltransferase [Variovorax paradoxus]|uniref:hypothetical protein n=1 Tax=Variovorax paradoxus TaxID=34073 RepID=UPI002792695F|nr:hypothetical protein [Variovorax paradoxus]MDQ0568821.1 arginyl-tRNA--protein-N-Asp/Glu arginylyltransferase [Variovorax paradoxus]